MANAFQRDAFQDGAFQEVLGQDFVLRGSQKRQPSRTLPSRIVSVNVPVAAIVTAQAVGRVRISSTADGSSIPKPLLPIRAKDRSSPPRPITSRILDGFEVVTVVVTAQAVGRARVRSAADGTPFAPAAGSAAVIQSKGRAAPSRLSATSRVVTGQEPVTGVTVTAQAKGRTRLRSTADGDSFLPGDVLWTSGQGPVNAPAPARLRSRVVVIPKPVAPVVTAQAFGRLRVRSSADGIGTAPETGLWILVGQGRDTTPERTARSHVAGEVAAPPSAPVVTATAIGRARVRATAVGTTFAPVPTTIRAPKDRSPQPRPIPSRILDGFEVALVNVVTAQATGRVRVSSTADGDVAPFTPLEWPIQGLPQEIFRARLRSRTWTIPVSAPVVAAQATGRVRVRSTTISSVIPHATITAQAVGRIRVRAKANGVAGVDWDVGVIVASTGRVFVAPVGTPAPTSSASVLDVAFLELGFVSEEGATFSEEKEIYAKSSWVSLYPKEYVPVGRRVSLRFVLREFNKRAVEFALEGSVAKVATEFVHSPPSPATPKALVLDWSDGSHLFRLYFPIGIVSAGAESTVSRTGALSLPVAYGAYASGGNLPYTMFMSN